MKKELRKAAAIGLTMCLSGLMMAGCSSSPSQTETAAKTETTAADSETNNGETTSQVSEPAGEGAHIGIIFTEAGLGGNSFNDLAFEGVKQAAQDLGITYDEVEPKSVSDEEIIQDEMAASGDYDLIICVGAEQIDALTIVATNYPEQKFALLDAALELPNVASYSCKEHEGSFLVGALAALAKQEKIDEKLGDGSTIGFIGGVDNPLINRFAAGYKAGALYINPDMEVLIDYAGGFNDPTTAKVISETFVQKSADVIFHASGASGMGVFQAAEEQGFVSIGVNLNQNVIAPDYIMASMLKKLDTCAYHAIQSVVDGTYTGENQVLGLSDGGVDYTIEGSNIKVTDAIIQQLDELKEKVVSGEIEVPTALE